MIRYKRTVTILLSSVLIGIIIMAIAYAAMQATLNVTFSKITQQALTWDIGFKIETVAGVPNRQGLDCGSATVTKYQLTSGYPKFQSVGDMCSYTFHIINNGNIAAKISDIHISGIVFIGEPQTTYSIGSTEFKLHYDTSTSTSLVSINDVIEAKTGNVATDKTIVLTVQAIGVVAGDYSFSYTITYDQY